jgi:hypothetical protein
MFLNEFSINPTSSHGPLTPPGGRVPRQGDEGTRGTLVPEGTLGNPGSRGYHLPRQAEFPVRGTRELGSPSG